MFDRDTIRTWIIAFGLSLVIHMSLAGVMSGQSWTRAARPPHLLALLAELVEPPAHRPAPETPRPTPPPPKITPPKPLLSKLFPRLVETKPPVEPPPQEVVKRVEPIPDSPPPPPTAPAPPQPAETPAASPAAAPPPAPALSVETDRSKSSGGGIVLPEGRKSSPGDASASGTSGTSTTASVPRSDAGSSASTSSSGTAGGSSRGITQWAHPQGGYQVHPSYPASARRLGIQGTARLRVQVLADGRVGEIVVESSAGHADLDRAAADAVRQWRFEPARKGTEPVATWVLLPVQFQLK